MKAKIYYSAAIVLFINAMPGICQDPVTDNAKQAQKATTNRAKGWFKGHHTPKTDETKKKALKIPTDSPVKVVSTDGTTRKGTLSKVTNDGIEIKADQEPAQSLAFDQISSLRKTRGPMFGGASSHKNKINTALADIPSGSSLNLKLADKTKVSGRYLETTPDGVKMQTPQDGRMVDRTIPEDQIASVQPDKPGLIHKPKFESPDLVRKNVSAIPVGSPMNLKTPDGKNVSGKLTGITENGFSLQTLDSNNIVNKDLSYDQVMSVKRPNPGVKNRIPGLHPPALQSGSQIKAAAMDIPLGSLVTLQMPDGSKHTGRLMGVTNDGMQVQSLKAGNVTAQNISYDQIGSIKAGVPITPVDRAKKYGTATAMVIVTGVISGALAGVL